MLARYILLVLLLLIGSGVLFGAWIRTALGWSTAASAALVVAVLFLVHIGCVIVNFALAARYGGTENPRTALGTWGWLRLVGGELIGFVAGYYWYALLAGLRHDDSADRGRADAAKLPLLLVHGYLCNRGFWSPLRRHLERQGFGQIYAVDLEPLLGDIDVLADVLHRRIEQIRHETGNRPLLVVAHSMGGLVTRRYLQLYPNDRRIARLITLATPHWGTELARFAPGINARQMRPDSEWLGRLNAPDSTPAPILSIYTVHDNIVTPPQNGALPIARNLEIQGIGHMSMFFSAEVRRILDTELE